MGSACSDEGQPAESGERAQQLLRPVEGSCVCLTARLAGVVISTVAAR